jgi:hypothetical protein
VVLPAEVAVFDLLVGQVVLLVLECRELGWRMMTAKCPSQKLAAHLHALSPHPARVALTLVHGDLISDAVRGLGLRTLFPL